jgi:hypothetical protein
MPRTQRFVVTLDGVTHTLIYTRSAFWRHVVLEIDGERYDLPKGAREEPFRLGDEQAILRISKNGDAAIFTREGEVQQE